MSENENATATATETAPLSVEDSVRQTAEKMGSAEDSASSATSNKETAAAAAAGDKGAAAAAVEAVLEAPAVWKAEHKELFKKVMSGQATPRELGQAMLDIEKERQSTLGRQWQSVAEIRRRDEQFQAMIKPYADEWQRAGLAPDAALGQLLQWRQYLAQNPRQALMELAQTYQVDLSAAAAEQPYVDPATKTLMDQVADMRRQLHEWQTNAHSTEQKSRQEEFLRGVQAFESATDEAGNPKYPHLDSVRDDIIGLIRSGMFENMPIVQALDGAYNRAIWGNPDVRTKLLEQQAKAEAQQRTEEAKRAQAASRTVVGKTPGTPAKYTASSRNLEDVVAEIARGMN